MRLEAKTAIVTGAASGIGRATAIEFAAEGATVACFDVDDEGGQETVSLIRDSGGGATFRDVDVSDPEAVSTAVHDVATEYDGLDVLFNNAGIITAATFVETTATDLDRALEVNVKGVWNGCQSAVPIMREQGGGAIVNMSSVLGFMGLPNLTAYGLTKGAILNFTRSLAVEVGPDDVRVNAICPAGVQTAMTAATYENELQQAERLEASPLRRFCDPAEIAGPVTFLASDEASYVTGEALVVDGGYTVSPR